MKTFFNTLACVAFTFAAASFLILNQVMATTNNQIGEVKGVSTVELAATTPGDGGGTTSYTLTVTKTGNGTVTASSTNIYCGTACSASFSNGTSVQLIAASASGYTFSGWAGDCIVGEPWGGRTLEWSTSSPPPSTLSKPRGLTSLWARAPSPVRC